ncbi:MAG: gamma-glutamylcyclotransferase family protein [Pseudomonadota bacterium]
MLVNVFAYGTLQAKSVMLAVTGEQYLSKPAMLFGYRRNTIKNRVYPAIIPDPDSMTEGIIYFDIDSTALNALDDFEDVLYDRVKVTVECGEEKVNAFAYVISPKYKNRLSHSDWNLEEFINNHLDDYL